MPNIKNQEKRVITNAKRALRNKSEKSELKTALKAVEVAVAEGQKELALEKLSVAYKLLDKAVTSHIRHKNYASRQKSRLSKLVNEA